jgi:hypothetical protein
MSKILRHLEHMSTKEFTQQTQICLHHYKEAAALKKQAVSYQRVKVRMPPGIVPKPLNSKENSRDAVVISKRYPEETALAFGCALTESAQ